MKSIFYIVMISTLLMGCGNGNQNRAMEEESPNLQGGGISLKGSSCYLYAIDKDTIYLKLNSEGSERVTGDLHYNFYERDGNVGFIKGEIHGDTLIGDYTFLSEGIISVREVGFLLGEEQVTEGYGDVEEVDGKVIFWHKDSLDFSNGLIMPKIPCDEIVLVDYDRFFPDSLLNQRK